MKPKIAYKNLRVSYITSTNIVNLLHVHVSATLVAILRDMPTKNRLQNFNNESKCKEVKRPVRFLYMTSAPAP